MGIAWKTSARAHADGFRQTEASHAFARFVVTAAPCRRLLPTLSRLEMRRVNKFSLKLMVDVAQAPVQSRGTPNLVRGVERLSDPRPP